MLSAPSAHAEPVPPELDLGLGIGVATADAGLMGFPVRGLFEVRFGRLSLASRGEVGLPDPRMFSVHETVRFYAADPREGASVYAGLGVGVWPILWDRPFVMPTAELGVRVPLAERMFAHVALDADLVTNPQSDAHVLAGITGTIGWRF